MTIQNFFRGLNKTDNLEVFLKDEIQGLVDHFLHGKNYSLYTRIQIICGRNEHKKPKFLCEVILDPHDGHAPIVIKKKSQDFFEASTNAALALKNVLSKNSNIQTHLKRSKQSELSA